MTLPIHGMGARIAIEYLRRQVISSIMETTTLSAPPREPHRSPEMVYFNKTPTQRTTSEVLSASLNELKLRRNSPSFTVDLVSFVLCNKTTLSFYLLLLFLLDNGKSHMLSCGVFTHFEVVLNRFSMLIVLVVILSVWLCVCGVDGGLEEVVEELNS